MATTLRFEFYELTPPKHMADPYLQVIHALSQVARPVTVEGVPLRVESFTQDGAVAYGTASKTQMENFPHQITPKAPGVKVLDLPEDAGLGRPTSFLVTQKRNKILLVLQRNAGGLRIGGFLDLIQHLLGSEPFGALPIILADMLQQVLNWKVYRSINIKVAHPATKSHYAGETARAAMRASEEAQALTVSFKLGMGRARKGTLSLEAIRNAIADFRSGEGGSRLEKLKIVGADSEDQRAQEIDLVAHRLLEEVQVPGTQRTLPLATLEGAAQQAYRNAASELKKHFGV